MQTAAARTVVALVGAEDEENLSLRFLAAAVEAAGLCAEIVPFDPGDEPPAVAARVLELAPAVVGISVPFQMHARRMLRLATDLRAAGFLGHVTVGGHFPTLEFERVLRDFPAVDSVVRHEGEQTLRELCEAVAHGRQPGTLPGLALRGEDGPVAGPPRRLPDLDRLPWPDRRGTPDAILGIPTAPILGSRGCCGDCAFCCIHAYGRTARGPRYRARSPEDVAREMKAERERRGVRLFVFHDDNFLVPHRPTNLARYGRLRDSLRSSGLDDVALVVKCRPDDLAPDIVGLLAELGVVRAYVGIETNSGEGLVSLNRRVSQADNRRALQLLQERELFCTFNLLVFDPETTLAGVEENLAFVEEFCDRPFNFCRAEVYAGTALQRRLAAEGRLRGDGYAWGYEMRDPRVELLFRIATTAFAARNFRADGVHNLNMGIRFDNEVLRFFYPAGWDALWHARVVDLSRDVGRHSAACLRKAREFVRIVDPHDDDAVKAFTIDLAREIARADLGFVGRIGGLRRELEARAGQPCHAEPA